MPLAVILIKDNLTTKHSISERDQMKCRETPCGSPGAVGWLIGHPIMNVQHLVVQTRLSCDTHLEKPMLKISGSQDRNNIKNYKHPT